MSEQRQPDESTITVKEAAERLRMKPATIRLWIREGRLPAKRIGERKLLIREADVTALVANASEAPARSAPTSDAASFQVADTLIEE